MSRDDGAARIAAVADRSPDAVRLARVASLAVRIEPHLLRRLRLRVVRDADVGAEADLWFSVLVDSRGIDAVVLHRDVAAILRDELTEHPRLDEIVSILADAHRDEPATIQLEERINALAVAKGAAAADTIDRDLRNAIVTMRESDARAREIARWFLRAAPRLHPVVQQCPNATALLLGASMLLARRSASEMPDTKTSLRSVAWLVPPEALGDPVLVGVERLADAIRFVEIPDQTATGAGPATPGRLSIPRAEPRLVEVSWHTHGALEQRVVEAIPNRVLTIGPDAADIRITTLAGDEYELRSVGGATPASAAAVLDLKPHADILRSCVLVRTVTEPRVAGVAVRVHPRLLVTAREPFGREDSVAVVVDGVETLCRFVAMPDYDDLVMIEFAGGATESVTLATPPLTGHATGDDGVLERQPEQAVVIGFDGTIPKGVEGEAEIDDFAGKAYRVLVHRAQPWFSGLAGGPVIMGNRVTGIVNEVHVPRMGDAAILAVIGAERLQDLLRRVLAQTQVEQQATPDEPRQDAAPLHGPQPPAWLLEVCVTIQLPSEDGDVATGLVVSDRLIVSTNQILREAQVATVMIGSPAIEARVLDFGAGGPLVFLAVEEANRFTSYAPLIRPARRVRQRTDPPDPADAMLISTRSGITTAAVPDATSAGVVSARDPDGYRFRVTIGENVAASPIFNDAILVWGDAVAGIAVEGDSRSLNGLTAEFLSVSVIRQSLEEATEAIARLSQKTTRLQAFISSTSDLRDERQVVAGALREQQIEPIMWELLTLEAANRPRSRNDIADSDLFILIERAATTPRSVAETQSEYEMAVQAGVDVMVFRLGGGEPQDEYNPVVRRHEPAWTREGTVHYVDGPLDEFRARVDREIAQWRQDRLARGDAPPRADPHETPPPSVSNVGASDFDRQGGLGDCRVARVVVIGAAAALVRLRLTQIPGAAIDPDKATRGVLWLNDLPSAPPRVGLVVHEPSSADGWPLVLDLEDTALAVIGLPFEPELEATARGHVSRVREANSRVAVVIALTRVEGRVADARQMVSRLSEIPQVAGVFAVSDRPDDPIDELLRGIVQYIDWNPQLTMAPENFAIAQRTQLFKIGAREAAVHLATATRPDWLARLQRLLGERAIAGEDVLIRDPALFESIVLEILGRARQQPGGLPAVRLMDVKEAQSTRTSVEPVTLARAVASEMARLGLAMVVEKTTEPVVVLPSLLETAFEPTVPHEATRILRAQWTGAGRSLFTELLVHFAYDTVGTDVQCAWQVNVNRGGARIGRNPGLYLEVIEFGEITELRAYLDETTGLSRVDDFRKRLRETVEVLLSDNASLTIDNQSDPS